MLAAVSTVASVGAKKAGLGSSNNLRNCNDYGKDVKNDTDLFAPIADASFKMMSQCFKATATTENPQFNITKIDDGVGLIKVNKDTGKVDKEIVLKDKKPEYQVDEIAGVLYYKANDKVIYAYSL